MCIYIHINGISVVWYLRTHYGTFDFWGQMPIDTSLVGLPYFSPKIKCHETPVCLTKSNVTKSGISNGNPDIFVFVYIYICIYIYLRATTSGYIYWGGDRLGWGHIRILYRAPREYTKPQNIIQRHKTLHEDLEYYTKTYSITDRVYSSMIECLAPHHTVSAQGLS